MYIHAYIDIVKYNPLCCTLFDDFTVWRETQIDQTTFSSDDSEGKVSPSNLVKISHRTVVSLFLYTIISREIHHLYYYF